MTDACDESRSFDLEMFEQMTQAFEGLRMDPALAEAIAFDCASTNPEDHELRLHKLNRATRAIMDLGLIGDPAEPSKKRIPVFLAEV